MKHLIFSLIILLCLGSHIIQANKIKVGHKHRLHAKSKHHLQNKAAADDGNGKDKADDPNAPPENLAAKPFLHKGWLKFFTYIPTGNAMSERVHRFEYNSAWLAQYDHGQKPSDQNDEFGTLAVPDDTHFFFILTKKTLYAVNARKNELAKTERSIQIDWLEPIKIDNAKPNLLEGGMEDLGNFKEGFCWRITSKTKVVWNLCADTMQDKKTWMEWFKRLMDKEDVSKDGVEKDILASLHQDSEFPFKFGKGKSEPVQNNTFKADGRWITIQDWSQCTLACGGGKQYLQRLCIPPKNGGAPCAGPAVLERSCNQSPCPNLNKAKKEEEKDPIVRMQRISTRPQRYEVCIVKEGDMDMVMARPGYDSNPRFPIRVVLNNRTLSVFGTPTYDSVFISFDLKYVVLKGAPANEDPSGCFVAQDSRDSAKTVTLCVMPMALKASESKEHARNQWINDINFFRDKCQERPKYVDTDPLIAKKQMMIDQEKKDNRYERIKEKEEESKEATIEGQVEQQAGLAMKAVEKELKYEQLAMKEEMMREAKEDMAMQSSILDEENKKKCLERKMLDKKKMNNLKERGLEAAGKIKKIQQTAAMQVQNARAEVYKKIAAMRKAAERRRRYGKKRIQEIRTVMASELLDSNKKGNMKNCNPSQSQDTQKAYCKEHFEEDIQKQQDCLLGGIDFCYVCCENEFGSNYQELREQCYESCENNGEDGKNGKWVFVNFKVNKDGSETKSSQ